jgi:hypothetical protein
MKEQKSKEGALLDGVNLVRAELTRLKKVKARSAIVESLSALSDDALAKARTVNKTGLIHYPDLQGARQLLVSVSRSLKGLGDGVGAKRVSLSAYREHLTGFMASMSSAEELINRHTSYSASSKSVEALDDMDVAGSKVASRERRERVASERSRAALERYRDLYGSKIPTTLKGKILQVATVPLLARFNSPQMTPKSLGRLGFDVDNISVESASGSDLGIVFNGQHLCMFSYANAIAEQEGMLKAEQEQNGALLRLKNLQKTRNRLRRELNAMDPGRAGSEFEAVSEQLDDVEARLASMENEAAIAKKTHKTRAKRKLTPEQALSDYAYGIVDVINNTGRSGIEWALVSPVMLRGFKSPDMCGAWLMPKSELQTLLRFTGGELKLRQWGLPWGA